MYNLIDCEQSNFILCGVCVMGTRRDIIDSLTSCDIDAFLNAENVSPTTTSADIPSQEEIERIIAETTYDNKQVGDVVWFRTGGVIPQSLENVVYTTRNGIDMEMDLFLLSALNYNGQHYIQVRIDRIGRLLPPNVKSFYEEAASMHWWPEAPTHYHKPLRQQEKPWIKQGKRKKGGRRKY